MRGELGVSSFEFHLHCARNCWAVLTLPLLTIFGVIGEKEGIKWRQV